MEFDELLTLGDVEFLEATYRFVLGRKIDQVGARTYLEQLQIGVSRSSIIARLATSEEGRKYSNSAAWINGLVELEARRTSHLHRQLNGAFYAEQSLRMDMRAILKRLDSIENKLASIETASAARQGIDSELAALISNIPYHVEPNAANKVADYEQNMARYGGYLELDRSKVPNLRERLDDYFYGTYGQEHGEGGPIRWTMAKATLKAKITEPTLVLGLTTPFETIKVKIAIAGKVLAEPLVKRAPKLVRVPVASYVGRNVDLDIIPATTICPAEQNINADKRRLGVLVSEIYCE